MTELIERIKQAASHRQIKIDVQSFYLKEQSDPDKNRYVFAYTVKIRNDGEVPARLISRHWVITDAEGNAQEVKGSGVVGEQPFLYPGEDYQYTSGTILPTPVGSMHGSYQLISHDGCCFEADIPAFSLATPNVVH